MRHEKPNASYTSGARRRLVIEIHLRTTKRMAQMNDSTVHRQTKKISGFVRNGQCRMGAIERSALSSALSTPKSTPVRHTKSRRVVGATNVRYVVFLHGRYMCFWMDASAAFHQPLSKSRKALHSRGNLQTFLEVTLRTRQYFGLVGHNPTSMSAAVSIATKRALTLVHFLGILAMGQTATFDVLYIARPAANIITPITVYVVVPLYTE